MGTVFHLVSRTSRLETTDSSSTKPSNMFDRNMSSSVCSNCINKNITLNAELCNFIRQLYNVHCHLECTVTPGEVMIVVGDSGSVK